MPASPGERGCGWAAGCEPPGLLYSVTRAAGSPQRNRAGAPGDRRQRFARCTAWNLYEPGPEREREKVPEFIEEDSLKPKEEKEAVPSLGRPSLGSLLQVPGICF